MVFTCGGLVEGVASFNYHRLWTKFYLLQPYRVLCNLFIDAEIMKGSTGSSLGVGMT
jgi:hypothetical protein